MAWLLRFGDIGQTRAACFFVAAALIACLPIGCPQPAVADTASIDATEVPSFYVRVVTGPLSGKSVCYVCRNGDRPVVLVQCRDLDADVTQLLKDLDRTVNEHRADGLRCFVVLLSEQPKQDLSRLQTLAFNEKLDIPLTMVSETATAGSVLEFPKQSMVSVVTYDRRHVVQRFEFKPGACDEPARASVIMAATKLLNVKAP